MRLPCRCQAKSRTIIGFLLLLLASCGLVAVHRWHNSCWNSVLQVRHHLGSSPCSALRVTSSEQCRAYKAAVASRSTDAHLFTELDECSAYLNSNTEPEWSEEEKNLPLAFAILDHRDGAQLAKLVKAIFRPWNSYCIQVDSKSSEAFRALVEKLVACYRSVHPSTDIFLSNVNLSLVWQHSSLLEGDLTCLQQLQQKNSRWKFYLNIVGSEFPLITNLELVRRLNEVGKDSPGFVDIKFPSKEIAERWKYSVELPKEDASTGVSWFGGYYRYGPQHTEELKSAPPFNLTVMYGIKNVAITRSFANFCLTSEVGKALRAWLQDVLVAVEHFWPTLAIVKIGKDGVVSQDFSMIEELNKFKMRKTFWWQNGESCHGEFRREICNLALADLPQILNQEAFVVNKFDSGLDPTIVECLSEIVYPDR